MLHFTLCIAAYLHYSQVLIRSLPCLAITHVVLHVHRNPQTGSVTKPLDLPELSSGINGETCSDILRHEASSRVPALFLSEFSLLSEPAVGKQGVLDPRSPPLVSWGKGRLESSCVEILEMKERV